MRLADIVCVCIVALCGANTYAEIERQDVPREEGGYVSGFTSGLNPPISEKTKAAKEKSIAEKLKAIEASLALIEGRHEEINEAFADAWREQQTRYETYKGRAWGHIGEGFFTLPPDYVPLYTEDEVRSHESQWRHNLESLIALNEFLEINGVQLMVVMYPNANAVAGRVFLPEFMQYPDEKELRIARELLEHDIETITFTDRAVAGATQYPFMYFYPTDFHPGEGASEVAAEVIAEHLARFSDEFTPKLDAEDFERFSENNCYREKFVYPAGVDIGSHRSGEIVRINKTYYRGKPIEFNPDSKLLVCGHSFIQTPASAAFLASALAGKTQYIPHNWQISSVGPYTSIPRRMLVDRETILRGKRVCVMIFDPYLAISRTIEPVNVREVDRRLLEINGRELRHRFGLDEIEAPQLDRSEAVQRFARTTHADERGYPLFQMSGRDATASLGKLELPQGLRADRDAWLLIEFSLSRKSRVEVLVGQEAIDTEFHQIPTWQEVFVKLPAGEDDIEVRFKALEGEPLVTIRELALYQ